MFCFIEVVLEGKFSELSEPANGKKVEVPALRDSKGLLVVSASDHTL